MSRRKRKEYNKYLFKVNQYNYLPRVKLKLFCSFPLSVNLTGIRFLCFYRLFMFFHLNYAIFQSFCKSAGSFFILYGSFPKLSESFFILSGSFPKLSESFFILSGSFLKLNESFLISYESIPIYV